MFSFPIFRTRERLALLIALMHVAHERLRSSLVPSGNIWNVASRMESTRFGSNLDLPHFPAILEESLSSMINSSLMRLAAKLSREQLAGRVDSCYYQRIQVTLCRGCGWLDLTCWCCTLLDRPMCRWCSLLNVTLCQCRGLQCWCRGLLYMTL